MTEYTLETRYTQDQSHAGTQDDCEEMIKLLEEFYNLNQIQNSLQSIILRQRNKLDSIKDNVEATDSKVVEGLDNLVEAKKYSFRYSPIIIGSILGAVLTGPAGVLMGLNAGGVAAGLSVSGGLLGGWCGYKIQK